MIIKITLLIIFFAVMIGVGFYSKKRAEDVDGFVLGSRSVGPWLSAFAFGTSYFSAVIFVGYAGQFGWKFGLASTWIGLGNAFLGSLLAWVVLGRRTRIMTQKLNSNTMPQFFEKRYNSRKLKYISAIIIFIFLIPYTASLYNGLSRLFSMAFNIDYIYCIILMSVITGIYVIVGGYFATALNDFIQGIIMLVGIVAVVIAVLNQHGGFTESIFSLSRITSETTANGDVPGVFSSFFGPDPFSLLCVVILTSLGTWGLPQMVQKFYAIRSEKDIYKGTIISTVFAIVVAGGSYFLGGFGRLFTSESEFNGVYDGLIPRMLENLPEILIGIVVVLVLSASMSTLSSLVLTSSSTLTLDLIKDKASKTEKDEKQKLFIMRALIIVFILISAIIAIIQYNFKVTFIAQMMGISWGALAGAFLPPFLYGLYWKKTSKAACAVSFFFGVFIMVLNMFNTINLFGRQILPDILVSPINCGAFAMLAGLVIVPVVTLITPKMKANEKEYVDKIFEIVREESSEISDHKL